MADEKPKTCWILVEEGLVGTLNQCLGIVSYLNISYKIVEFETKFPWSFFSPFLRIGTKYSLKLDDDAVLSPPYPDLILSAGRKAVAPALMLKKKSLHQSFLVHVLDPKIPAKHFNLIITPKHDPISAPNVVKTVGAPNLITHEKITQEAHDFAAQVPHLHSPKIAVLIGGTSKAFTFSEAQAKVLGETLQHISHNMPASLLVTMSRRTGTRQENIIKKALEGTKSVIWDGKSPNPYFAYLGLADYIIVTSDSASMISEAATTGKPVYIFELEGGAKRIDAFKRNIVESGYARLLKDSKLESYKPSALNDAKTAHDAILKNYAVFKEQKKD